MRKGARSVSRILITGATGRIGTMLRPRLARPGRVLRLLGVTPVPSPGPDEEVAAASVTDLRALVEACSGGPSSSATVYENAFSDR
jgi:uronate dehydrogenase